jgi:hypothetical protein
MQTSCGSWEGLPAMSARKVPELCMCPIYCYTSIVCVSLYMCIIIYRYIAPLTPCVHPPSVDLRACHLFLSLSLFLLYVCPLIRSICLIIYICVCVCVCVCDCVCVCVCVRARLCVYMSVYTHTCARVWHLSLCAGAGATQCNKQALWSRRSWGGTP